MQSGRLPKRVPVGTRYVVEGRSRGEGQVHIFSRYLVFPDGRCFDLPSDPQPLVPRAAAAEHNRRKH
jgi:hypothetical protein